MSILLPRQLDTLRQALPKSSTWILQSEVWPYICNFFLISPLALRMEIMLMNGLLAWQPRGTEYVRLNDASPIAEDDTMMRMCIGE
jgi:hypothetical protein